MKKKRCSKCGKIKNIADFYGDKNAKRGLNCWCKICHSMYAKKHYKKNRIKTLERAKESYNPNKKKAYYKNWYSNNGGAEKVWEYSIKKKFGINKQQYEKILKSQNNKCAICGKLAKESKKRLAVDHNHKNGYIRGLLCAWCNWYLLRFLKDNKKFAAGIVNYLSKALKKDKRWE